MLTEINKRKERTLRLQTELSIAEASNNKNEIQRLRGRIALNNDINQNLEQRLLTIEREAKATLESELSKILSSKAVKEEFGRALKPRIIDDVLFLPGLSADIDAITKRITDAVAEQIRLENTLTGNLENQRGFAQQNLELALKLGKATALRQGIIAQQAIPQAQEQLRIEQERLKAQQRLDAGRESFVVQELRLELGLLQIKRDTIKETSNLQKKAGEDVLNDIKEQKRINNELILFKKEQLELKKFDAELEREINELITDTVKLDQVLATQNKLIETTAEDAKKEIQRLFAEIKALNQELADETGGFRSIGDGIVQGIIEANAELPSAFQTTKDIVKDSIEGISEVISDSIVDAFDPNSDKSLSERWLDFIQDIERAIIEMLVRVALTKALLGIADFFAPGSTQAAGLLAGAAAKGGPIGKARGGRIQPFSRARGLAGGGIPQTASMPLRRPAGLPPTDTVPIWATPGEYMVKKASVSRYGHEAMDAINRGLVDPLALSGLAMVGKARGRGGRRPSSRGIGFAAGGSIPTSAPELAADAGPNVSIVVASDQAMDDLLAGGENAMVRFIEANSAKINAALGN